MELMDIVLLIVGREEDGQLRGRTLLQKKCYFVSRLLGMDFGFAAYHYGPYSREVFLETKRLVAVDFLDERTDCFPTTRNIFGETTCYTYSLSGDGKEVVQDLEQGEEYSSVISAIEQINQYPISHDFNELSIAAKVHYIVQQEEKATVFEVRQKAEELGWRLTKKQIEDVCDFLAELELIERV